MMCSTYHEIVKKLFKIWILKDQSLECYI